ncbi:MAG: hypothetical protein ABTQ25_01275 [Nitrosomonas ureae]
MEKGDIVFCETRFFYRPKTAQHFVRIDLLDGNNKPVYHEFEIPAPAYTLQLFEFVADYLNSMVKTKQLEPDFQYRP